MVIQLISAMFVDGENLEPAKPRILINLDQGDRQLLTEVKQSGAAMQ